MNNVMNVEFLMDNFIGFGTDFLDTTVPDTHQMRLATVPLENAGISPATELRESNMLIAKLAIGLWRLRRSIARVTLQTEQSQLYQHCDRIEAQCEEAGLRLQSFTQQRYVDGMAVKVVSFQTKPGIVGEWISETVTPAVYLQNHLIHRAEVIVDLGETSDIPETSNSKVETNPKS